MTALTQQYELKNVDWATFGNGDARDGNTTVTVSGVTGSQRFAFLYWGELNFSGSSDTQITVNGTAVTGTTLGTSVDTCWGSDQSVGYFANVSDIVNGDGKFTVLADTDAPHFDGAIRALALETLDGQLVKQARAAYVERYGNPKWVGIMPPNVAVNSPEGDAMFDALEELQGPDGMGVLPWYTLPGQ